MTALADTPQNRVPLWPKEALRPASQPVQNVPPKVGDVAAPVPPVTPAASPSSAPASASPAKAPLAARLPHGAGAGRAVFGAEVSKPAQAAGKAIFGQPKPAAAAAGLAPAAARAAALQPKTVVGVREGFLATEATQRLELERARMGKAAAAAARQRLATELARAESVLFTKRQELQRVEIRQRAVEASRHSTEAHVARLRADHAAAESAARDRQNERHHLESLLADSERDFDRRLLAEKKSVEAVGREISGLARRGAGESGEAAELRNRRVARERGAVSIDRERSRRRAEATNRIATVTRELGRQEGILSRASRELLVAEAMLARYRLQEQGLAASRSNVESEVERSRQQVDRLRLEVRRLAA